MAASARGERRGGGFTHLGYPNEGKGGGKKRKREIVPQASNEVSENHRISSMFRKGGEAAAISNATKKEGNKAVPRHGREEQRPLPFRPARGGKRRRKKEQRSFDSERREEKSHLAFAGGLCAPVNRRCVVK